MADHHASGCGIRVLGARRPGTGVVDEDADALVPRELGSERSHRLRGAQVADASADVHVVSVLERTTGVLERALAPVNEHQVPAPVGQGLGDQSPEPPAAPVTTAASASMTTARQSIGGAPCGVGSSISLTPTLPRRERRRP